MPMQSLNPTDNGIMYKITDPVECHDRYTSVPCGVCPVAKSCGEGMIISPATCEYMTSWLNLKEGLDF